MRLSFGLFIYRQRASIIEIFFILDENDYRVTTLDGDNGEFLLWSPNIFEHRFDIDLE